MFTLKKILQKLKYLPQCSEELKKSCEMWIEDDKDDEGAFRELALQGLDLVKKDDAAAQLDSAQLEELQNLKEDVIRLTAEVRWKSVVLVERAYVVLELGVVNCCQRAQEERSMYFHSSRRSWADDFSPEHSASGPAARG